MQVLYYKELMSEDFPVPPVAAIKVMLVDASNIAVAVRELIDAVQDVIWIDKLDVIPKVSFEATALRTVAKLVAKFGAVQDKLTSDVGEYLVSHSASRGLEEAFGHSAVPISELWKEKISGNHGFDFHSESVANVISFGEAKYKASSNPYDDAAKQVISFFKDSKDKGDSVHLQYFVSGAAMEAFIYQGARGVALAFSVSSPSPIDILGNALDNTNIVALAGLCDELYVIGVVL
jgi:hypothetical protein